MMILIQVLRRLAVDTAQRRGMVTRRCDFIKTLITNISLCNVIIYILKYILFYNKNVGMFPNNDGFHTQNLMNSTLTMIDCCINR